MSTIVWPASPIKPGTSVNLDDHGKLVKRSAPLKIRLNMLTYAPRVAVSKRVVSLSIAGAAWRWIPRPCGRCPDRVGEAANVENPSHDHLRSPSLLSRCLPTLQSPSLLYLPGPP